MTGFRMRVCPRCKRVVAQHAPCPLCSPSERHAGYDRHRDPWEVAFRRSAAWRRVRDWVLMRDGYICQHCLAAGRREVVATEVHHIVPLWQDRSVALSSSNLVSLCHRCHMRADRALPRPQGGIKK